MEITIASRGYYLANAKPSIKRPGYENRQLPETRHDFFFHCGYLNILSSFIFVHPPEDGGEEEKGTRAIDSVSSSIAYHSVPRQ